METDSTENVIKLENSLHPLHWSFRAIEDWKKGEELAYRVYKDRNSERIEQDLFFEDYFLTHREPILDYTIVEDSIRNTFYYLHGHLVAFTSHFLCDFRDKSAYWHGIDISNSIVIIPRKTFAIRSPKLIDSELRIPFVRKDNLEFIKNTIDKFPKESKFSICAHLQPESLLLLRNLVRLSKSSSFDILLSLSPKIKSISHYLSKEILETMVFQEINDSVLGNYVVVSFSI